MLVVPHPRDYTSPLSSRSSVTKRRHPRDIFRDQRPKHVDPQERDDVFESIFVAFADSRLDGWLESATSRGAA